MMSAGQIKGGQMGNVFLDNILSMLERDLTVTKEGGRQTTPAARQEAHHAPTPAPSPPQQASNPQQQQPAHLVPTVDVYDLGGSYELVVEAPGVSRESIEVRVTHPRTLMLSFEKPSRYPACSESARPTMREVQHGTYMRGLMFKAEVDAEAVKARYENGVILVTLPKRVASLGRRIPVE